MGTFAAGYSRSAIDRAGDTLREFWIGDDPADDETVDAFRAMIAFRETFQVPLGKTVMGLRSMVRSECPDMEAVGAHVPVVQRLKRREQVLRELARMPETKLSNMGDIGGCRAVLPSRSEVDGVLKRIRKNWKVHGRTRDTRDEPAPSGYRALHVIVMRDSRRIEIQLRTPREHEWAVAVERTGTRLGFGLKEGEGPAELLEYFRLAGQGLYLESQGIEPDREFEQEFRAARRRVRVTSRGSPPMPLIHFLLVYDRDVQKLVVQRPFSSSTEAVAAYEAMEERCRDEAHMEIVLVGADSIETVMLTHGNYFDAIPSASPYLAGI